MRRRPPGLGPEDAEAWARIAATVRPLRPPPAPPRPAAPAAPPSEAPGLRPAASAAPGGAPAPARPPHRLDRPGRAAPGPLDRRLLLRLARGADEPQARLDLHGLTREEARHALEGFIRSARARGLRLVLVITGKGRVAAGAALPGEPTGALRREVPLWLAAPPFAAAVLWLAEAHRRHGGGGALYVALRRPR